MFPLHMLYFSSEKVIGKALVLDEIINYIQSLQHQVEVYFPSDSNLVHLVTWFSFKLLNLKLYFVNWIL